MNGAVPGIEALTTKDTSTDQALALVNAAITKAKEIKTRLGIAVVDAGCNLTAFVRMDGFWQGSLAIAIRKAHTCLS